MCDRCQNTSDYRNHTLQYHEIFFDETVHLLTGFSLVPSLLCLAEILLFFEEEEETGENPLKSGESLGSQRCNG